MTTVTRYRCRRLLRHADAPVEHDVTVLVDAAGLVLDVVPSASVDGSVEELDGLVIPGLVDAHSHLRGVSTQEQGVADTQLERWVVRLGALTPLDPYADALVAASELLGTGVTAATVVHHSFATPDAYAESARAMRAAMADVGLTGDVVLGVTDGCELTPEGASVALPAPPVDLDGLLASMRNLLADQDADVRWAVGPVGPQWCSTTALDGVARLAASTGVRVHTHLMETEHQRRWRLTGTPTGRLADAGLLNASLSVAHGVWLDPDETARLSAAGVTVVHCPTSNRRLGSGEAPVARLRDAGVQVALGLDSVRGEHGADLFAEMRAAVRPGVSRRAAFAMATVGGAAALGRPGTGEVRRGGPADLVLLDGGSGVEQVVAETSAADVRRVVVRGRTRWVDGAPVGCPDVGERRRRLLQAVAADAPHRQRRLAALAAAEQTVVDALAERREVTRA